LVRVEPPQDLLQPRPGLQLRDRLVGIDQESPNLFAATVELSRRLLANLDGVVGEPADELAGIARPQKDRRQDGKHENKEERGAERLHPAPFRLNCWLSGISR